MVAGVLASQCDRPGPVSSTWTATVAPADQQRTVEALTAIPELRLCASITGDSNVAFTFWTRIPDRSAPPGAAHRGASAVAECHRLRRQPAHHQTHAMDAASRCRTTSEVVPPSALRADG